MSPVLGGAARTQLRFTVQGPPSPPVVLDTPVPASGVDMVFAPPASGGPWGFALAGALASVSLLPLAAMPSMSALASSEEIPPSGAAAGTTPESWPWFPRPRPGPLAAWAQPAANAA